MKNLKCSVQCLVCALRSACLSNFSTIYTHAILKCWKKMHRIKAHELQKTVAHITAHHSHKINMFSHIHRDERCGTTYRTYCSTVWYAVQPKVSAARVLSQLAIAAATAMAIIYTRCDTFSFIHTVHASPLARHQNRLYGQDRKKYNKLTHIELYEPT